MPNIFKHFLRPQVDKYSFPQADEIELEEDSVDLPPPEEEELTSAPSTQEGALCMKEMALEAGDKGYARLAGIYARFPAGFLKRKLAKKLCSPARQGLYENIYEKIRAASLKYPKRVYGEELDGKILGERKRIHQKLHRAGFSGKYPVYTKGNVQIVAAEEHPFTTMEAEDFTFRIRFMVSRCRKEKEMGRNCGFFSGRGREGRIQEDLDLLLGELEE